MTAPVVNTQAADAPRGGSRSSSRNRPRGGRWATVVVWVAAAAAAVPAVAVLMPGAGWYADLLANLSAQAALVTATLAVIALALGRRRAAAVIALPLLVHIAVLTGGVGGRSSWWPLAPCEPTISAPARKSQGVVRLLHFNASVNQTTEAFNSDLTMWDADVVSITEPPGWLWGRRVRWTDAADLSDAPTGEAGDSALSREPFWARDDALVGGGLLWARGGFAPPGLDLPAIAPNARSFIAGTATLGGIETLIIAVHPQSPRTLDRWSFGNDVIEDLARVVEAARTQGVPVIVLADLNSTPTGWRSRRLARAGLTRAKPWLHATGTWPTKAGTGARWRWLAGSWPATIAIDDIWVSDHWRVRAWSRGDARGSDHWPVIVDLEARP